MEESTPIIMALVACFLISVRASWLKQEVEYRKKEVSDLQWIVESLSARVYKQSELLSRRARRKDEQA